MKCARPRPVAYAGFTLVELLIVVSILLILSSLTLALFNSTSEADRIRSSARQLQSALLGARDRAIQSRQPRGLRLLLEDSTDPMSPSARTVSGMVYIGAEDYWPIANQNESTVSLAYPDFDLPTINWVENNAYDNKPELLEFVIVKGVNADWSLLLDQGLIDTGSRIEIPRNSGDWYTIDVWLLKNPPAGTPAGVEYLLLPRNGYRKTVNGTEQFNYRLELNPSILPGQEPLRLSSGIVIDMDRSIIPSGWYTKLPMGPPPPTPPHTDRVYFESPTVGALPKSLDIMFTPRGWAADSARTPISPSGVIHFYLCTQEDAELNLGKYGTPSWNDTSKTTGNGARNPADPQSGEKLILSFFPRTGNVATFPVDVTDSNNDGLAEDPFRFAKLGGTAGR